MNSILIYLYKSIEFIAHLDPSADGLDKLAIEVKRETLRSVILIIAHLDSARLAIEVNRAESRDTA